MVVLNDRPEPELFRASLRIPVGRAMTDSFHEAKHGNLLALVDRETGVLLVRAAARLFPDLKIIGLDDAFSDRSPLFVID